MPTQALSAPHSRVLDALELVAEQYGTHHDLAAVEGAGGDWRDLAIAMLAEAAAALLLDIRPRPGSVARRAR